jgi:hypothetical protein
MTVAFILFLAIVLGIFGLWGFLRGWKAALVMLVLIVGSLLLLSVAPESVQAIFDYINKAAALVTGSTKPLINTAPSSLVVFMLIGAVILGFLLGFLRIFRAKPSFMGFLLGFISGYFFTAYMLAALMPQRAILPLPIKIPGLTTVSLSAAAASPPSTVSFTVAGWVEKIFQMPCLPTAIVAGVFLFILLTIFIGNRSSRKG